MSDVYSCTIFVCMCPEGGSTFILETLAYVTYILLKLVLNQYVIEQLLQFCK